MPDAPLAGDGTAGRRSQTWPGRRARVCGWRLASRGLVAGSVLICGWVLTGIAAHAYAARITAPAAPRNLSSSIPGVPLTTGSGTAPAGFPAIKRPAPALLAQPEFHGGAGVGAGDQATGKTIGTAGQLGIGDPVVSPD